MEKIHVIILILFLIGFAFASCVHDNVSYCPFCGKSGVMEISKYDPETGITSIYYECTNSECGKKFGAGQISKGGAE